MTPSPQQMTEFLTLLTSHERFISGYIYSLIPNNADAEDLLQDVKLALWNNFEQFEIGTNFAAWSKTIAYYRIMAFRKKKAIENKRIFFSDECVKLISESYDASEQKHSDEIEKLEDCLSKLSHTGKEMIFLKYKEDFSINEISIRMNKSVDACYKALSRFRLQLRKCLSK